ncbi:DUF4133 domain-containing protein [Chitinophaga niabensis]|uniref:DUF4133 domain-containing protein n=1 Tax=Chitinophaga niabensis TaxID=536979 RepID=A0A1N6KB64_9BACT|nr:DUF4133 domain-containing protein [Chitinophaga niabensis]SIO53802.1 protein of unknown function [Chitinophaga niabensis]
MSTVYQVNKGINRSIEFKGIKAQYIIYLAVGLVTLLLLFTILYVVGVSTYMCMAIIIPTAAIFYTVIQRISKKYGEHGLTNYFSRKRLPSSIQTKTRNIFFQLSEIENEEEKELGRSASNL